jgi:hypothetical protein
MRIYPKGDRGREGLSPSPPSEPCVRFSRTRLSGRWFPHRDWLANTWIALVVNNPCVRKGISYLPPMTPLPSAANMRSLHCEACTHNRFRSFVSAPCLTLAGTTGAALCSHCGSHASTSLSPFPRHDFAFRAFRGSPRFGTMETLTPAPLTTHSAGLPAYCASPSCRSVSNHVGLPEHRLPPRQRAQRISDFALSEQARRSTPAESSSLSYGPTFRLRLLSTPLRADAVTFSYGAVAYSGTDFHRADVAPSRAHSPPNVFIGGPVPNPPGFPLKACGNDGLRIENYLTASCGESTHRD